MPGIEHNEWVLFPAVVGLIPGSTPCLSALKADIGIGPYFDIYPSLVRTGIYMLSSQCPIYGTGIF